MRSADYAFFGLGTLPMLLSFAYITHSVHISGQFLSKLLAVMAICFGLLMMDRGLAFTGPGYNLSSVLARFQHRDETVAGDSARTVSMTVDARGYHCEPVILQLGKPVLWLVQVEELTPCNRTLIVPAFDLELDLKVGSNVIQWTPIQPGVIGFSCWMGMMKGSLIVGEESARLQPLTSLPRPLHSH